MIAVRDQAILPADHLVFAEGFGKIVVNRVFQPVEGHPQIARVFKDADQKQAIGEGWHTDHSYDAEPAMGSILHAIEVPPVGGDTVFVSMSKAYAALSETMQRIVQGLSAWHSSRHAFGKSPKDTEGFQSGRSTPPRRTRRCRCSTSIAKSQSSNAASAGRRRRDHVGQPRHMAQGDQ